MSANGMPLREPLTASSSKGSIAIKSGAGLGRFLKPGNHWLAIGFAAALPAMLAGFAIALKREVLPEATLWHEIFHGTLDLMLAALVLGLTMGMVCRRRPAHWRHGLPAAAGLLAGLLALGLTGGGPALMGGDGEGNFDAEPAAYAILLLYAITLVWSTWWPRDGSAVPLGALTALSVVAVAWSVGVGGVDLTTVSWWLSPAALAVAGYTWLWLEPKSRLLGRIAGLAAWALVGALVLTVAVISLPFGWFWSWRSAGLFALVVATLVFVPAVPIVIDLWRLARQAGRLA